MANAHERLINSLMKSKKDRVQRAFEKWDFYRRLRENNEDDTVGQIQEINVHRAMRAMALELSLLLDRNYLHLCLPHVIYSLTWNLTEFDP